VAKTVIAVCGKGGVGKTTVSALLTRSFRKPGGPKTLIIDADPAGGLAMALGLAPRRTLNDVRITTFAAAKNKAADREELAASLDYLLLEAITEVDNLAFLPIGRPEEIGCFCSVNSLLRDAVETLVDRFDLALIDAEAGVEQINRQVMRRVTHLLLVADTSVKALRVAETIHAVAGAPTAGLLINRVRDDAEAAAARARTSLPVIGLAPEDALVRRFDAEEMSFFEMPSCPAGEAVQAAVAAWFV
jgi:CO dehydrogenase maturation factor